ncbi:nuclear transport factor 2 family protein [Aurantiacibacter aquimixticola]|uniref:Nuclear transport factor 2 family protein n=1 Tax=Aurantiacibacter aquimixticola TaxID=1958945 RepID=A0A419RWG5_9SPHN|nr:nuclear transport factor 2 family protein [Aurantiacibacter aquimixticola]RJY10132.1 nuclear transport factor 2 family protein [Aurantiacibacter aquimixticola]
MSIESMAKDFFNAVKEDRRDDYQAMWADNIVSLESGGGPMSRVEGREQLLEKHAWWEDNTEVHSTNMEGPYVIGDQFAVRYEMDVTMDGERSQMAETGVYTVRDGKIAEERFFYPS